MLLTQAGTVKVSEPAVVYTETSGWPMGWAVWLMLKVVAPATAPQPLVVALAGTVTVMVSLAEIS